MGEERVVDMGPAPLLAAADDKAIPPTYRRRKCWSCCAISVAVLLLVIVIFVILLFTVFKAKDPDIKVRDVTLESLDFSLELPTFTPTLNMQLNLDITVHNPNKASFRYTNSTTLLYYDGNSVGEALIPAGQVRSDGSENIVLSVSVQAAQFLQGSNFTSDLRAGIIPISSVSRVSGRVNVLNIYKHYAVSTASCDITVFVANATMKDFVCHYKVKL